MIFGNLVLLRKDSKSLSGKPYYIVKCNCGSDEFSVRGTSLVEANTVSCGCYQISSRYKEPGISSWNAVITGYKAGALSRKYIFDLTFESFVKHSIQNCHYCGEPPRKLNKYLKSDGTFLNKNASHSLETINRAWIELNGLDRIDNSKGYIEGNILACCFVCNKAKGTMSYKEFIDYLEKVIKFKRQILKD